MGFLSTPNSDPILVDGKIVSQANHLISLTNKIKKLEAENKASVKRAHGKEINANIQLLILKYSGIFDFIKMDNINKAILFSKITNRGPENIRQFLSTPQSKISNKAKRKNLEIVIEIFEKLNLQEATKLAKRDLKKIPVIATP